MNAWLDRLIDLGREADAACWRHSRSYERQDLRISSYFGDGPEAAYAGLSEGNGRGRGYCGRTGVLYPINRGDGTGGLANGDGHGSGWTPASIFR